MKILIIINNLGVGGAERLVVDDINEMLTRGIDVKLITLKLEKSSSLSDQCKISSKSWVKIDFGSFFKIKSWFLVSKEINNFKPDVLITHLWYSNTIGRIAGKICGVNKIVSFEHNIYENLKTSRMFFLDKLLQIFSYRIIAVSVAVKNSLIKNKIKQSKISVILNGIDTSKYQKNSYRDVKKELGIVSKFNYLFIGRLIHQKGVDILIRAFSKTKESGLVIVGTGKEELALRALAKELGVSDRIYFLGIRNDVPDLLYSMDCFVLPSRYEGLGMVLLEAIAAKKIIVVSNFEAASEIIKNNVNGIIVEMENVDSLYQALFRVAKESSLREALVKEVSKISLDISIKKHVDLLLTLIR